MLRKRKREQKHVLIETEKLRKMLFSPLPEKEKQQEEPVKPKEMPDFEETDYSPK